MSYNGFILREDPVFSELPVKFIRLYNLNLDNISYIEGTYRLKFSGSFANNTKPYVLNLNSNGFTISDISPETVEDRFLELGEIAEVLKINNKYDIDLNYVYDNLSNYKDAFSELCALEDDYSMTRKALCTLIATDMDITLYSTIQNENDFVDLIEKNSNEVLDGMIISKILNLDIINTDEN